MITTYIYLAGLLIGMAIVAILSYKQGYKQGRHDTMSDLANFTVKDV